MMGLGSIMGAVKDRVVKGGSEVKKNMKKKKSNFLMNMKNAYGKMKNA